MSEKNIYNYENFDSISSNPDIDIVYIVLPNSMHKEYTIRAAKAGKHVICEKPMAMNSIEAEEMISEVAKAGKKLFIGYRLHYEPHNIEAMRIGQNQVFGKVKILNCSFGICLKLILLEINFFMRPFDLLRLSNTSSLFSPPKGII